MQCLKQQFCLYQSTDHYNPDPGSQATLYNGHSITVLIWSICFSIRRLQSHQKKT